MQIEVSTIWVIQYFEKLDIVYDREKKIFASYHFGSKVNRNAMTLKIHNMMFGLRLLRYLGKGCVVLMEYFRCFR